MNIPEVLSQIDAEISRLNEARNLLAGHSTSNGLHFKSAPKKRTMSAEARERIAAAQRRRWAKQKAAK